MKIVKRVLLAVLLAVLIVFPMSYDNAYVHILLSQTLVNIVIVMGLNFITGLTGQMNLGTAGIMALGAYIAALTSTRLAPRPGSAFSSRSSWASRSAGCSAIRACASRGSTSR